MDDIISTKEAAKILDVAQETVSRLIHRGLLKGKKLGTAWAVSTASVYAYKEMVQGKEKNDPTRGQTKELPTPALLNKSEDAPET